MSKATRDALRNSYLEKLINFLRSNDEEVLITGTNEFALPCVDSEGNDEFIVVTVKVPTGSRDGDAYDGYSMAEDGREESQGRGSRREESREDRARPQDARGEEAQQGSAQGTAGSRERRSRRVRRGEDESPPFFSRGRRSSLGHFRTLKY